MFVGGIKMNNVLHEIKAKIKITPKEFSGLCLNGAVSLKGVKIKKGEAYELSREDIIMVHCGIGENSERMCRTIDYFEGELKLEIIP